MTTKKDIDAYLSIPSHKRPYALYDERIINEPTLLGISASKARLSSKMTGSQLNAFLIDLSWKSSELEGNSYTLIDSKLLIESGLLAKGKNTNDAVMILNHKRAIDYMMSDFTLSTESFFALNALLLDQLSPVEEIGFRGGQEIFLTQCAYSPTSDYWDLKNGLDRLIHNVNNMSNPINKAWILFSRVPYLQACFDGNKRTSRLLASQVLLSHGLAPISYQSIDNKSDYLAAMLYFYETEDDEPLKDLFIDAFVDSTLQYKHWKPKQRKELVTRYDDISKELKDYFIHGGSLPSIIVDELSSKRIGGNIAVINIKGPS